MKISVVTLLLAALLLTGCGAPMAQVRTAVDSVEQAVQSVGSDQSTAKEGAAAHGDEIGKDQAVEIALKHAGFKPEQVKYLRADYEIDDGIPQYEVQFHQDRWEYDYEINAQTGDIMSWDRDD